MGCIQLLHLLLLLQLCAELIAGAECCDSTSTAPTPNRTGAATPNSSPARCGRRIAAGTCGAPTPRTPQSCRTALQGTRGVDRHMGMRSGRADKAGKTEELQHHRRPHHAAAAGSSSSCSIFTWQWLGCRRSCAACTVIKRSIQAQAAATGAALQNTSTAHRSPAPQPPSPAAPAPRHRCSALRLHRRMEGQHIVCNMLQDAAGGCSTARQR